MKRLLYILFMMIGFYSVGIGQITVNTNFTPNIAGHIDSRCVLTNLADTSTIGFKYEGMLIYVAVLNKFYYYETYWKELASETLIDSYVSNNGYLTGVGTSNYLPVWGGASYLTYSSGTGFVKVTNGNISYDNSTYLTSEVDGSTANEIEVVDEAYSAANFNGGTTSGVSQDDFYDYQHTADTDDDGKVNIVDLSSAGFVKTDVSGNLSVDGNTYLTTETDGSTSNELNSSGYWDSATGTVGITDAGGTKSSAIGNFSTTTTGKGFVPGSNSAGNTYFLRADATWAVPSGSTYSAGYGLGLTGSTFYNSRYWKDQDTVKTSLTGILKATSGLLSAAVAGTDYQSPLTTGNLTESITGLQFDNTRTVIGGSAALSLSTGYYIPNRWWKSQDSVKTTLTGILQSTAGLLSTVTNGTGFFKNNGSGVWSYDNSTYLTTEVDGSITNEVQNLSYDAPTRLLSIDGTGSTDVTLPTFATNSTDAGLVNGSNSQTTKFLRGDNTWQTVVTSDANTTYTHSAETVSGGANIRLTGSDSTNDDIKLAGSGATTVTRTDANTITISSTDTNSGGTVTSVTGTSPIVSSEGNTPAISINSDTLTSWRSKQNQGVIGYNDKINSLAVTGTTTKTITLTQQDGGTVSNTFTDIDTDTQLSAEQVQDYVGAMLTGNTENNMNVDYQDSDGTIDFNITMDKDIVANAPLSGGANNVLIGNDSDVSISVDTTSTKGLATKYNLTQIVSLDSLQYNQTDDSLSLKNGEGYYLAPRIFSDEDYSFPELVPNPRKWDMWYIFNGTGITSGLRYYNGSSWILLDEDNSYTNEVQGLSYTASSRLLNIDLSTSDVTLPLFSTTGTNAGLVNGSNNQTTKFLRGDNTWQTVVTSDSDAQTLTADSTSTTIGITASGSNSRVHFNVLKSEQDGSTTNELNTGFTYNAPDGKLTITDAGGSKDVYSIVSSSNALGSNYLPVYSGSNSITNSSGTGFVKVASGNVSYDNSTYITGNQLITLGGDATGSGTTSITVGVVDNSHNHNTGTITDNIVSSVENVANDGGNIDLVASGIISISGDDGANTITIGATETDGSTSNELNTSSYWESSTGTVGITDAGGTKSSTIGNFSTTTTAKGFVPGSNSVGNTYFLRADATWAVPAGSSYSAGYRLGLSSTTFNNTDYWKNQDTLNVADGLVLATSKKLSAITNNSANWNTAYGWGDWKLRLGANTTGGTLDWNHATNARPGTGETLLYGNATNGFGVAGNYYHAWNLEYTTKDATGNIFQMAYPYQSGGIYYRTKYSGTWNSWKQVWTSEDFANNSTNWNTAYSWGNHASAGYLTGVASSNKLAVGSGASSLTYSSGTGFVKVTAGDVSYDNSTYLTSQTSHADVVVDGDFTSQGFMKRGATSGTYSIVTDNSTNWNTAYGWGNHASAGYLTSISLTGDVTGTGTTSISTTIADNSVDGTDIALGSDAQGDVMYYNGTDWARLAAGTSGQFLKTQGAGANPIWDAAGGSVTTEKDLVTTSPLSGGQDNILVGADSDVTISITQANTSTSGYLSSTDWNTFNNKQSALTTGSLTESITGLQFDATRQVIGGAAALSLTAGYVIPTTTEQTNWNTAYTDRMKWDGGSTGLVASTGRTSLGATTVGSNMFTLTNPSAITFPRFNADNTVTALSAADFRTAIDANGWKLTGNSGTTAGTNFVGTTDAVDFVIKANNTELGRFYSTNYRVALAGGIASGLNNISFGLNAGYGATNAPNTIFAGAGAGYNATNASYANFYGQNAGNGATSAAYSNFFGTGSGQNATAAEASNFFGQNAGTTATNAYGSNFFGQYAGLTATNAYYSNFFGGNAGREANAAGYSNFFGLSAGYQATSAANSNFMGWESGYQSSGAYNSNFLGDHSGYIATNATHSNFLGTHAGYGATAASLSNIFGYHSGKTFTGNNLGSNNIIIGTNITLGNGAANGINIGGIIFGTGAYGVTSGNPSSAAVSGGKIGIGTVTPARTLDVTGEVRVSTLDTDNAAPTTSGKKNVMVADANGDVSFRTSTPVARITNFTEQTPNATTYAKLALDAITFEKDTFEIKASVTTTTDSINIKVAGVYEVTVSGFAYMNTDVTEQYLFLKWAKGAANTAHDFIPQYKIPYNKRFYFTFTDIMDLAATDDLELFAMWDSGTTNCRLDDLVITIKRL